MRRMGILVSVLVLASFGVWWAGATPAALADGDAGLLRGGVCNTHCREIFYVKTHYYYVYSAKQAWMCHCAHASQGNAFTFTGDYVNWDRYEGGTAECIGDPPPRHGTGGYYGWLASGTEGRRECRWVP